MAKPTLHTVRWHRIRMSDSTTRYVRGTTQRLAQYCGHNGANIRSILNKWQKDLDYQYGCTYTRVYVDLVKELPEGAHVDELT